MEERKEVITLNDIIYSIEFWGILIIAAIMLQAVLHNYFLLSVVCFGLIKYFGSEKVHFHKNKLSKFILRRYPYSIKLLLSLAVIVAIMLSWMSFKAFVCSIIFSICWKEYMKMFVKKESLI